MNSETLKKNKMFEDIFDMKPTERVPIMFSADNAFCLEYAGMNLKTDQYDINKNLEAIDLVSSEIPTDVVAGIMLRLAAMYDMLGATNFVMGGDGFIQHPNTQGLMVEEYDELIADPYKCIWDKVLPRIYKEIGKGGIDAYKAISKAFFTFYSSFGALANGYVAIANKYGKSTYSLAAGAACVPFDILSDQLRSFTGTMQDIRRRPQKVVDACDAMVPMAIKAGLTPTSNRYNRTFIPLHMGPYMKPKDFEKFYWPSFKKFVDGLVAAGTASNIFVEQDYTPYLDYLYELPQGQLLYFEYGNPRQIKDKLGKKHILDGLYPLALLKSGTKQACLDKIKEYLDILAPGGLYIFAADKQALHKTDVNKENLLAVLEYVLEHGRY